MPSYVIQNDDYLTSGYVDSSYVGTDSDLYVVSGYIQDAIEGVASVSSVATVNVNGGFLLDGNSTSSSAFTISITGNVTRDGTASSSSVCSFLCDADVIRSASATTSAVTATTVDADVIRSAVIAPISAGTVAIQANAIVSPGAEISASATTTINAIANKVGVVGIQAFQTHPTLWQDDVTWDNPVGTVWGPMVEVKTNPILSSDASLSSAFSVTADGDRTAVANIAPAASATVTVFGTAEIQGLPNVISSSATATAEGILNAFVRDITISASATVEASGIFQVAGYPEAITGVASVTTDGDVIRDGVVNTIPSSASVTSKFGRIRPHTTDISSAFDLSATAVGTLDAVSIVASAGTLSISAIKTGIAKVDISSEVTLPRWVGGKLFGGIVDIQAFAVTVSALTIYNIDPFRVYVIDSETRLLGITQETRISAVNSETRVNSIEEETRAYKVPSETRTIEVQPLELVELSGIKDRRDG